MTRRPSFGVTVGVEPAGTLLMFNTSVPAAALEAIDGEVGDRVTIAARAHRLNLKPFGLRLIIEEHERLRQKMGRRPNMEQLERAVEAAAAQLARLAQADAAHQYDAELVARRSQHMAGASVKAIEYLRACA